MTPASQDCQREGQPILLLGSVWNRDILSTLHEESTRIKQPLLTRILYFRSSLSLFALKVVPLT